MRVNQLFRTPEISGLRLDQPPETEHRGLEEEVCSNYAVNFVDAGTFGLGVEQKNWKLSPGYVFLSRPGNVHRYTHQERAPSDVCLSVIYSRSYVEQIDPSDHFVPAGIRVTDSRAPVEASLRLLEGLHELWARMMRSLSEDQWCRGFIHPALVGQPDEEQAKQPWRRGFIADERGVLTVEGILPTYAWHGKHHTAHITSLRERMGWS